jgi:hypothetical protein
VSRTSLIARSVVACVGAFVAGWWVIGDQSSTGLDRPLDYVVRAPGVPDAAVVAMGVVGLVVVAGIARVVTAGSVGANIGVGLALFGGGAVISLLVRYAVREERKLPVR